MGKKREKSKHQECPLYCSLSHICEATSGFFIVLAVSTLNFRSQFSDLKFYPYIVYQTGIIKGYICKWYRSSPFPRRNGNTQYCPVAAVPLQSKRGHSEWYPEKRGKIKQSNCSFGYLVLCPLIAWQNSNLLLFSNFVTVKQPKGKGEEAVVPQILDPDTDWKAAGCLPSESGWRSGDLFLHYLTLVPSLLGSGQVSGNNVRGYCSGRKRWRVYGKRWLVLFYQEAGPALPTFVTSVEDRTVVMNLVPFTFFGSRIPKAHGPLGSLEWGQENHYSSHLGIQ